MRKPSLKQRPTKSNDDDAPDTQRTPTMPIDVHTAAWRLRALQALEDLRRTAPRGCQMAAEISGDVVSVRW